MACAKADSAAAQSRSQAFTNPNTAYPSASPGSMSTASWAALLACSIPSLGEKTLNHANKMEPSASPA
jgi:hypothetical protein